MYTTPYKYLLLVFVATMFLPGCKKDNTVAPATVTGTWVNAENRFTDPEYYEFTANGQMYLMNKTYGGFNRVTASTYSFTGSQLIITGSSSTGLYNVVTSGDTLFLNNGNTNYLTLLKSSSAPRLTDWASVITPQQAFTDTVHATGIAYYNSKLYTFKQISGANKLIEYSTTLSRVSAVSAADDAYDGVDFAPDGTMWVSRWEYAYKFNMATGAQYYQTAATPSSTSLWALTYGNGKLYTYRSNSISSYYIGTDLWQTESVLDASTVTDIAYADGYVYMVSDGTLYKMLPGNSLPLQTYYLANYTLKGVAYAGNGVFWVCGQNRLTSGYEMVKVTIN